MDLHLVWAALIGAVLGSLADWLFVTPMLVDDFRVVSVDFRGHGKSDPVSAYSFEDGVADARGVVDALDLRDPVIVGHSLGDGVPAAPSLRTTSKRPSLEPSRKVASFMTSAPYAAVWGRSTSGRLGESLAISLAHVLVEPLHERRQRLPVLR